MGNSSRLEIVKEVILFLRERKRWWLAPIIIFLVLFGIILVVSGSSAVAPFIYTLF